MLLIQQDCLASCHACRLVVDFKKVNALCILGGKIYQTC